MYDIMRNIEATISNRCSRIWEQLNQIFNQWYGKDATGLERYDTRCLYTL